MIVYDFAQSCN